AIENKKRVCAVGTTSMRAIESAVSASQRLKAASEWTSKFIYPPYEFSIANSMITNFHVPQTTLLVMIAAFAGYENVMNAYEIAVKEKYRFYTYGDAMLTLSFDNKTLNLKREDYFSRLLMFDLCTITPLV